MTVPLLRVCYHCGYPTPGRHASSCRDADSGVVEVAKPLVPAAVAQQIRDVEAQRDGLAELLKGAVEAGERLRQELDEARAEQDRWRRAEVDAWHEMAAVAAERDRMRPVVEAAEQYRRLYATDLTRETCYLPHRQRALLDAVDAYRSAASPDAPPLASLIGALPGATLADWSSTPDAEPAPGVPVDTEATP